MLLSEPGQLTTCLQQAIQQADQMIRLGRVGHAHNKKWAWRVGVHYSEFLHSEVMADKARRMARLSARIFGEVVRQTTPQ
jgi:hypothetical protein